MLRFLIFFYSSSLLIFIVYSCTFFSFDELVVYLYFDVLLYYCYILLTYCFVKLLLKSLSSFVKFDFFFCGGFLPKFFQLQNFPFLTLFYFLFKNFFILHNSPSSPPSSSPTPHLLSNQPTIYSSEKVRPPLRSHQSLVYQIEAGSRPSPSYQG